MTAPADFDRVALVVNPYASAVGETSIAAVADALTAYADIDVLRTEGPRHAMELVRDRSRDVDAVIVYSGDGGFNEALNGLDEDIPIGFLPGGGTSVLSRALGIPRDAVDAARTVGAALAAGRTRRISLGRVGGRRFGVSAGIGLDAEIVRRVDDLGRSLEGRRPHDLAFAWQAAKAVTERRGRFEPSVEIEGAGSAAFALVANCDPYTYLGAIPLHIAPEARFELGLDLVAPKRRHAQLRAPLPRLRRARPRADGLPGRALPPRRRPLRDPLFAADASPGRR